MTRILRIFALVGFALCVTANAEAVTSRETTYRYSQLWSGMVRFVRVDNRYPIVEKAKKEGYLLFEYKGPGASKQASFELVPIVRDNKRYVKMTVRIQDMPSYVEAVLLDQFERKLKAEFGPPPSPRLVAPPPQDAKASDKSAGAKAAAGDDEVEEEEQIQVDEDDLEDSIKEED